MNIKCFFGLHENKLIKSIKLIESFLNIGENPVTQCYYKCKKCGKLSVKLIDGHWSFNELKEDL